ncbi:hypothetical protein HDU77_003749 [Chytriomyces hyalinus]|nr:hypothetical protein HDU77_003749 [Chytriomyces hyalinus]
MRQDVFLPDLVAFGITLAMTPVMVSMKAANRVDASFKASNTHIQSSRTKFHRVFQSVFSIFNLSLAGMMIGSIFMLLCLAIPMLQSHSVFDSRGAMSTSTFGVALYEICYCTYSWCRSKSIIKKDKGIIYYFLATLVTVNPVFFSAQFILCIMGDIAGEPLPIQITFTIAAVAGLFFLDLGLLSCFIVFLVRNPAPTTLSGLFNGNPEAERQWKRTNTIAVFGAAACGLSFLALGIIVLSQTYPPLFPYINLMNAFAYSVACLGAITLLAMKLRLEAAAGNSVMGSANQTKSGESTPSDEVTMKGMRHVRKDIP